LGETVELEIACAADIPAVYADPGQLEGALVNLALNSRDAMPRGGRLSITATEARQRSDDSGNVPLLAGNYVVFAIRDTGLGMAPEVLARAFEPFFTTKEPGRGTGLGLSMVYGFVKQSGGHISVDSRLGYGTSIELYLPVAESNESAPLDAVTIAPAQGRQTILVVEDEADVREIATAFLRSNGYAVVSEGSAEAALSKVASQPAIAMAFLDVVLGSGMNGIELAHEIRRRRPGLPVLLTSGYEGSRDDAGGDAGAEFDLVRKPYLRQELLAAVRKALDGG
jgi:CheY-like chemotaxis protein